MIKIRRNVFETNSSSVHSIVICNEPLENHHPDFVFFALGEFGWSMGVLDDSWARASYFYTAACSLLEHDVKDEIIELLTPLGIDCIFDEDDPPKYVTFGNHNFLDHGGIDHVDECKDFVDALMHNGEMLARFILDDRSFVVTGNDNCDDIDRVWMEQKEAKADAYLHTTFYKGN